MTSGSPGATPAQPIPLPAPVCRLQWPVLGIKNFVVGIIIQLTQQSFEVLEVSVPSEKPSPALTAALRPMALL